MPQDESSDPGTEAGETVAAILLGTLPSLHTPVSPELCAWLGKQVAATIIGHFSVTSPSDRLFPSNAAEAASALDDVRGDIVAYLLRRTGELVREIWDGKQDGPWEERDHLYDELEEVTALVHRLQRVR